MGDVVVVSYGGYRVLLIIIVYFYTLMYLYFYDIEWQ